MPRQFGLSSLIDDDKYLSEDFLRLLRLGYGQQQQAAALRYD